MRVKIAAHLDEAALLLASSDVQGVIAKLLFDAAAAFTDDSSGVTRLHGKRILGTLQDRMSPAKLAALVATVRQTSMAARVREALRVAATGNGPAMPEVYAAAYGAATTIAKAKEYLKVLTGLASAHAASGQAARVQHAERGAAATTGAAPCPRVPKAASKAPTRPAVANSGPAPGPGQAKRGGKYGHVKSKVAAWVKATFGAKRSNKVAPAPVPAADKPSVPTPTAPKPTPVLPSATISRRDDRSARQLMMAPRPTGDANQVSADRKPAVKLAWMAPAKPAQPQNTGNNSCNAADAQHGKVKLEGVLPSTFPEPRANGKYLSPGISFVSAAEDVRRLGTRIPLRRVFSLRHRTTTRE
jgi:hypothetical protein